MSGSRGVIPAAAFFFGGWCGGHAAVDHQGETGFWGSWGEFRGIADFVTLSDWNVGSGGGRQDCLTVGQRERRREREYGERSAISASECCLVCGAGMSRVGTGFAAVGGWKGRCDSCGGT